MTQAERAFIGFKQHAETIYPQVDRMAELVLSIFTNNETQLIYSPQSEDMMNVEIVNKHGDVYTSITEDVHVVMFALFRVFALILEKEKREEMEGAISIRSFEVVLVDYINRAILLILEESAEWEETTI